MTGKVARIRSRLPTYAAYIRERPSWLAVLIFGRLIAARRIERWVRRAPLRGVRGHARSRLSVVDESAIMPALARDGVYHGLHLCPADVASIVAFAERTKCFTRSLPQREFHAADVDDVNRDRESDVIAGYFFDRVEECDTIRSIAADPLIVAIAEAFVGRSATHIRTRLWWSFPAKRVTQSDLHAAAQNKFHFDLNDFRTIKFFFYLTDADEHSGAHAYIAGSHGRRKLAHQFTFMVGHDDDVLRRFYPPEAFRTIAGPAGTGFAEDPFVFHQGLLCRDAPRLLLEIEYGPTDMSPSYRYGVLG